MGSENLPTPQLTRNQGCIFAHLQGAQKALGAYEIATALGISAPITVYRALAALTRLGLIRRVRSQNAYVACTPEASHRCAALIICSDCHVVREVKFDATIEQIRQVALRDRFSIANVTLEVVGRCIDCHLRGADQLSSANHVGQ